MQERSFFISTGACVLGVFLRAYYAMPAYLLILVFFVSVVILLFACIRKSRSNLSLACILLCFSFGIIRTLFAPMNVPEVYDKYIGKKVTFIGTVVNDPSIREKNQQVVVQLDDHAEVTNVLVFAPRSEAFEYGDHVTLYGALTLPEAFATDGGHVFRYDHYLAKSDIFLLSQYGSMHVVARARGVSSAVMNFLFALKHSFVKGLARALPVTYAALATGLLTGDQHSIDAETEGVLLGSGLIWVVVLSGYHVTIIAEGILKATKFLQKKYSYLLASLSVCAIILATGASAPSLRGGAMTLLMLYSHATNRTYNALRALCVSIIFIVLWNPLLLAFDTGLQLSLIVTPALIIAVPLLEVHTLWIKSAILRDALCVSIVAQLSILPLVLWETGNISVWALPANMLVMSFVPFAMASAVLAGCIGIIAAPSAPLFGFPAHVILFYILSIARIASTLPFAGAIIPPFSCVFVIAAYAILIYSLHLLSRNTQTLPTPLRSKIASRQLPS